MDNVFPFLKRRQNPENKDNQSNSFALFFLCSRVSSKDLPLEHQRLRRDSYIFPFSENLCKSLPNEANIKILMVKEIGFDGFNS